MYTITVKGSKAEKKKKAYAKIELILYKPAYNRVHKVLEVTEDFNYGDQDLQHILPHFYFIENFIVILPIDYYTMEAAHILEENSTREWVEEHRELVDNWIPKSMGEKSIK